MSQRSGSSMVASGPPFDEHGGDAEEFGRLQPLRRIDLLAHLSGAFDLAESAHLGHAARVAHIALSVAQRLGCDAKTKQRVLYVGLLHDAGVAVRQLPEDIDETGGHTAAGAWAASLVGLDEQVQQAIRATHERWDGDGRPHGLSMASIPEEALLVSAAHWVSDTISPEDNPLRARKRLLNGSIAELGPMVGSRIAEALSLELRGDAIWMPLWDDRLPAQLAELDSEAEEPSARTIGPVAAAFGDIVDASTREPGRAGRVATLARELGRMLGMDEADQVAIAVAGHMLDLGHLGVPKHIIEKPDILSVEEMEIMRRHPGWGAQLLERIPGFERIADWVQHHHERPDGRGYPSLLERDEIPLQSFVLAAADAYWALRADRSDRPALPADDVLHVMRSAANEQFLPDVVEVLPHALGALEAA